MSKKPVKTTDIDIYLYTSDAYFEFFENILMEYNTKLFSNAFSKNDSRFFLFNPIREIKDYEKLSIAVIDFDQIDYKDAKKKMMEIYEKNKKIEFILLNNQIKSIEEVFKIFLFPDKFIYLEKPVSKIEFPQICVNLVHKNKMSKIKSKFLSSMSHELKTPLSSISGFSSLILESFADKIDPEIKQFIEIISHQSKRMERNIENLVYLNESSKEESIRRVVYSDELLLGELKQKITQFLDHNNRVKWLKSDNFIINCDKDKIINALINIIENSLKFSIKDVNVKIKKFNNNVYFYIVDLGIGIMEQNIPKVFEKFFRVENEHHNMIGLGLGLSISKNIIKQHGGYIKIKSVYGKGTGVMVRIPLSD